ncbi:MAG TPA: DUF692 domain-containing protein [Elusimicrobiota bacterium]|nr:DUF692 domain-containing protein [Elusimicrobiota bacterium]
MPPASARGVGLGLRPVHYEHALSRRPAIPWFEVISENYMGSRGGSGGGRPLEKLLAVRRDYPVSLHGVSMNLGSADPLNRGYLAKLKDLVARVEPAAVSDHLCWTGVGGRNVHDLLPLPYDEAAVEHLAGRIREVQDFLGRRLRVENVSSYVAYRHSAMPEWEFLSEVARRADCAILLDVNNIFVSATNHGFDPRAYLDGVPAERVEEIHLAGYSKGDGLLIDTHDHPVSAPVWDLYAEALRRFGPVPTLIEWDERIPSFARLEREAARAREVGENALAAA